MKHTGVFATEDETKRLKEAAKTPYIVVAGIEPPSVQVMCHGMALEHGLPEIPGYYGLDLETGEFLAAEGDLVVEKDKSPFYCTTSCETGCENDCEFACQTGCEHAYQSEDEPDEAL
jgi:hypothetical protein